MHQDTKKSAWLVSLWHTLYCGSLETNLYYLWTLPVCETLKAEKFLWLELDWPEEEVREIRSIFAGLKMEQAAG